MCGGANATVLGGREGEGPRKSARREGGGVCILLGEGGGKREARVAVPVDGGRRRCQGGGRKE